MHLKNILIFIAIYAALVLGMMALNLFVVKNGIPIQWAIFGMPMLPLLQAAIQAPADEFNYTDTAFFALGCLLVSLISVVGHAYYPDRFPAATSGPIAVAINLPFYVLMICSHMVVRNVKTKLKHNDT